MRNTSPLGNLPDIHTLSSNQTAADHGVLETGHYALSESIYQQIGEGLVGFVLSGKDSSWSSHPNLFTMKP